MNAIATPEKFAAANKAGVDTLLSLLSCSFAGVERLATLMLNTASTMLETGIAGTKSLMGAKSPEEVVELQARMMAPLVETLAACARGVQEIAAQKQEEVAKLLEGRRAALSGQLVATLDDAARYAPAGSEASFDAARSAIAATSSACESMTRAARHVAELAGASVATVTETAVKSVNAAVEASSEATVKAVKAAAETAVVLKAA